MGQVLIRGGSVVTSYCYQPGWGLGVMCCKEWSFRNKMYAVRLHLMYDLEVSLVGQVLTGVLCCQSCMGQVLVRGGQCSDSLVILPLSVV